MALRARHGNVQPPFLLQKPDFARLVTSDEGDYERVLFPALHAVDRPDFELRTILRPDERREQSCLRLVSARRSGYGADGSSYGEITAICEGRTPAPISLSTQFFTTVASFSLQRLPSSPFPSSRSKYSHPAVSKNTTGVPNTSFSSPGESACVWRAVRPNLLRKADSYSDRRPGGSTTRGMSPPVGECVKRSPEEWNELLTQASSTYRSYTLGFLAV